MRDCCLVTDGAAAVVMTRADRARDLSRRPVYLLGGAHATTHRDIAGMPDLTVTGPPRRRRARLMRRPACPADIDVVELYDAFTINTILFLEDLGFCAKGEGGALRRRRRASRRAARCRSTPTAAACPTCHPGMYGLFTIVEAAQQLMGGAGERQVADAKLALAHGNGGELSSQAMLVLGSAKRCDRGPGDAQLRDRYATGISASSSIAYTERDTMLYALGLGTGADPIDEGELRFVYEKDLQAVPTMATVLGSPGFWWRDPRTGADWVKLVHGEQAVRLFRPLPVAATLVATQPGGLDHRQGRRQGRDRSDRARTARAADERDRRQGPQRDIPAR